MGNEPDEEQQVFHMLMHCNTFDLEDYQFVSIIQIHIENENTFHRVHQPERYFHLIEACEQVDHNLHEHPDGAIPVQTAHACFKRSPRVWHREHGTEEKIAKARNSYDDILPQKERYFP